MEYLGDGAPLTNMRTFLHLRSARSLLAVLATFLPGATAMSGAEEIVIRSGPERVSLVELFTSEGCSSCPPAEKWLGELRRDPRLWKTIVPVAFHVDYWDGLGWKDRFAQTQFTARQRAYAATWRSASVYTPGFVIDGREWRGFFARAALPASGGRAGKLEARANGGAVTVRFEPEAKLASGGSAHAAWLGFDLVSDVRRGENSGQALRHNFIALRYATAKLTASADNAWTARIDLPASGEKAGALAVWIEANGTLAQAAGGFLTKAERSKPTP